MQVLQSPSPQAKSYHSLRTIGSNTGDRIVEHFTHDRFSPSEVNWKPPGRAQFAQIVFGGEKSPDKLAERLRETGIGGTLRKGELQSLQPEIFALPQNIETLPTLPNAFSFLSKEHVGNLLYSNNPESIKTADVKLMETQVPPGRTRVMAHHHNATDKSLQLATTFRNRGDRPVHLTLLKHGQSSRHMGWAGDIGLDAYKTFLKDKRAEKHEIPPGGSWTLDQGTMRVDPKDNQKNQVTSSLSLVSTNGPLEAITAARSLKSDSESESLKRAELETSDRRPSKAALKFRGSGRYAHPDQHNLGLIPMNEKKAYQVVIGPQSSEGGTTFDGEYGQERRYSMIVGADAKPGQRLAVLAWAGGEDPVAVRTMGDESKLMRLVGKRSNANQVGVVYEGVVSPGQVLDFTQMIQGGAATPLRLIFLPLPAPSGLEKP